MAGKKTVKFTKDGIATLAQDKPVVYTVENAAGNPLYIGSAKKGRVGARLQEHLPGGRDPIRGAAKVKIVQKPLIAAAQKTEARMIKAKKPPQNIQGK